MNRSIGHMFLALLAFAPLAPLPPMAHAQIQSTISCPAGHGFWDTLSVMVLDPGLNANYHLEGTLQGGGTSYSYVTWDQAAKKVYYVKDKPGFPWDINLYDSNYVYQWITENVWTDPNTFKKFNNGSGSPTADYSMRWAARCAAPGGENSSFWNPGKGAQPYSTRSEIHSSCSSFTESDVKNALLEVKSTSTYTVYDHRTNPATAVPVTTMPLQYSWGCSSQSVKTCSDREVFDYAIDTGLNPVDNVKHSYGLVQWRHYKNSARPTGENWVLDNTTVHNHLQATSGSDGVPDFPCF